MLHVVGPLPPPVHGAAAVTQAVAALCEASGIPFQVADTSPGPDLSGWRYHLGRARQFAAAASTLMRSKPGDGVYHSLSGGLGLAYDLVLVALNRLRGRRILFHHHSFAYLNQRSALMAAITTVAGTRALHLVLSPTMQHRFQELYGAGLAVATLSNLAFFELTPNATRHAAARRLATIGYLSNVTREKGIDRFLAIVEMLRARGSRIEARIAGPIADPGLKAEIERKAAALGGVHLVGPLYGAQKDAFLADIDLFVFPSRYANEAQPLVMFEALLAGTPVVGTARGCMPDLPSGLSVTLLDKDAENLAPLVEKLLLWERDADAFRIVVESAQRAREELRQVGVSDRIKVASMLAGTANAAPALRVSGPAGDA